MDCLRKVALAMCMFVTAQGFAIDFPLTENAIRDAYFLGNREGGVPPEVLRAYSKNVRELHEGNCISQVRIETPFLQAAKYFANVTNYSAQDAVKEFHDKRMDLRAFVDVCYVAAAPAPKSVRVKFSQKDEEVLPETDVRTAYLQRFSEDLTLAPNGERGRMEFDPKKMRASTLTVEIDTPDKQHAEATFDLQSLR